MKNYSLKYVAATIFSGLAVVSCTGKKDASVANATVAEVDISSDDCVSISDYSLQLPDVPAAITDEEAAAAYMAVHYWDYMDFNDTVLVANDGLWTVHLPDIFRFSLIYRRPMPPKLPIRL